MNPRQWTCLACTLVVMGASAGTSRVTVFEEFLR